MALVKTGLEKFIESPQLNLDGKRIGLLCNPASVDRSFRHARELLDERLPGQLTALFSPQHGFFAEKQDNMVESDDIIDPFLKIPVFSLYGKTRIPTKEMFDRIDILLVDLQDVGTRVYTFIYTISYCLEEASKSGKKIIILDRPNPIGGIVVEGNCLNPHFSSFVGRYPIPMRHGLTIGEVSQFFNVQYKIGCELEVIGMEGWKRDMYFTNTGLPWIPPSPNLPTPFSAFVYPGQVIWEGTNVSEGRGTSQPFELFGAPFIDFKKILKTIGGNTLPGVYLRPVSFEPTSNKWSGKACHGFQIHITNINEYSPYFTSLKLLQAVIINNSNDFQWKQPPYEYEYENLPVDLIIGDQEIRKNIEDFIRIDEIADLWKDDLDNFAEISRRFHLYS
ncbi:MAG: DUF1343 domain-containing protein [Desulfobacterales bacterium]|jgi:uncharacterized protein YbbC (DUF1343 family)|nr:DUF1343 domain-containing protein [Desulfobacteraceae bacterium]MBT4364297.1 DUF1343 domain-containing protein [Desulfobacteraceae bacterium]MBT7086865.1 DUF1343 domain-containing protein [Desulfobacterales bacterium]